MGIMGRNIGRVGGAVAGIIAIIFGILDAQDKVPSWLLITLGALAIAGVLADVLWDRQDGGDDGAPLRMKQRQEGGRKSTNNQAGRDININQMPPGGNN